MNLQMEFEGSDDDIRAKFETYLLSLLLCSRIMSEPPPQSSITATLNNSLGSSGGGSVVAAAGEVKQQQASLSKCKTEHKGKWVSVDEYEF